MLVKNFVSFSITSKIIYSSSFRFKLAQRSISSKKNLLFSSMQTINENTEASVLSVNETDSKILSIVDQISKLTLLQVAELNSALKEKLKIPDAPVMSFAASIGNSPVPKVEEDAETSKVVQTSFTLKISKFDETKKIALIKEIKNIVDGLNLVQAKKFVETIPQVVKNNISKEEADKLKSTLEAAGATCEID